MTFQTTQTVKFAVFIFIFIGCLALSRGSASQDLPMTADDLIYLTENFPPHNYEQDGVIKGASIEILELIWDKLGSTRTNRDVALMPWARAIKRLENEPNVVLFGMGYSVERAKKFHWIGPYYKHNLTLIAKKTDRITIHHINDAKRFLIGVVREDFGNQFLLSFGFSPDKLDPAPDIETLFNKLNYNRFQLVCYPEDTFFKYIATHHPDKSDIYEPVFQISNMRSGFGFSKKIPVSLIRQFQTALDELKAEGAVDAILQKYNLR
jgi:polar amino acid transport system substrate-binding protein